jgi:hypothetical protein
MLTTLKRLQIDSVEGGYICVVVNLSQQNLTGQPDSNVKVKTTLAELHKLLDETFKETEACQYRT